MMALTVRPVTSADAAELADLINPIIAAGGTTALEEPFTPESLDEAYLTGPKVQSCVVAVDNENGRLEGFQTLGQFQELPEGAADIGTFARIDVKQKGVGTALFAATCEAAERLGIKEINATIRADNAGGLTFYTKQGFEDYSVSEAVPLDDGTLIDRVHKRFKVEEPGSVSLGRQKLGIRDSSDAEAPALKKKGRGWEISEKRLDALHQRAREMRRDSTEAHKVLADRFSKADLGRYTFKRHAVVGSAIVDFHCPNLGMAIQIDEDDQNEALAKRRDKSLEAVGIRVMRIAAQDIIANIDPVLERITAGMRMRIADKRQARRNHFDRERAAE